PDPEQRVQQPAHEGALLRDDVGAEKHIGLERNTLAMHVDVGPIDAGGGPLSGVLWGDRSGGRSPGQNRLRPFGDSAGITAELLVRERLIENSDLLPDMYETDRPCRNEQLRLQYVVIRDDLHLRAARVGKLPDIGLERGDAAMGRSLDDVLAPTADLGNPLLDAGKFARQALDLACDDRRELLEGIPRFSDLVLACHDLLFE